MYTGTSMYMYMYIIHCTHSLILFHTVSRVLLSYFMYFIVCKEVPVVMATSETDQPKRTVGTVRVMPHHTWAELKALVQDIISSYRNILRGGLGTGMMGNRNTPTYPINIGQAKISRELKDAIEVGNNTPYAVHVNTFNNQCTSSHVHVITNIHVHVHMWNLYMLLSFLTYIVHAIHVTNTCTCVHYSPLFLLFLSFSSCTVIFCLMISST